MTFDGSAEAAAIMTRLASVAGGRVSEGDDDGDALARWADGSVKPHVTVSFGEPIPLGRDRGLAVTEDKQMHSLPFVVTSIANSADSARDTSTEVGALLIGWVPNPPNSGEVKGAGGYSFTTLTTETKPTTFRRMRFCEVVVGLST